MANNNSINHGTQIREKMLQAIVAYIEKHGYPPTIREIGNMVGLKSTSSVHAHMEQLFKEGKLETDVGIGFPRAIRVPGYRFIKAPVAVGDIIYEVIYDGVVQEAYINKIEVYEVSNMRIWGDDDICFYHSDIGKTVFLTSEEAEAAKKVIEEEGKISE